MACSKRESLIEYLISNTGITTEDEKMAYVELEAELNFLHAQLKKYYTLIIYLKG